MKVEEANNLASPGPLRKTPRPSWAGLRGLAETCRKTLAPSSRSRGGPCRKRQLALSLILRHGNLWRIGYLLRQIRPKHVWSDQETVYISM